VPADSGSASLRPRSIGRGIKDHAALLLGLLSLLWIVETVDLLPFLHLDRYGIHPRATSGLPGILTAPFLHAGFGHLLLNSFPFLVFGGTVLLSGVRVFWSVTIFVIAVGGFGVWLFGERYSNHIGASGLVFGYLGFLLARGVFEKSFASIVIAGAILIGYGGLLMGVLPVQAGVSWQSHLFGLLAGVLAARLLAGKPLR
jgi:membrane associated rhomboid family serine protease